MVLNKMTFNVFLLISFSFFKMNIASASSASMCSNPTEKICKETQSLRMERDARVKVLKQEILLEAQENAAPKIVEMRKKTGPLHFIRRAIQTFKINNQEIMKSAKKRITGFEEVVTDQENVSKIKKYMEQAIAESFFSEEVKLDFKNIVKTIQIGNFADYIEKSGQEDSVIMQLIGSACGLDGLVDNAFATTINKQRYVLICPGFLITLNQSADKKEKFNSILQAIAHEMGHHLDNSKVGNELYSPYLSCLVNNYSNKFNKSSGDEKFCKKNPKEIQKCNQRVVLSHAGELIADQWGIKVTALHAKEELYSNDSVDQMLISSWEKLCGSGDEGIHPSGEFRMNDLMGKNPELSNYLGCQPESRTASCTLEGEIFLIGNKSEDNEKLHLYFKEGASHFLYY